MNIAQDDLNGWRRTCERLRVTMQVAAREIVGGPEGRQRARELVLDTATNLGRLGIRMEQAGAERPPEMAAPPDTRLELLDTPANRRYLAALQEAWECGLAVDRERYGPNIGTDGEAQVIEMVLADKMAEVFGPERNESRVG